MNEIGRQGEKRVAEWLAENNYIIVEQNWRIRTGEIDIIALDMSFIDEPILVFVEVKTLIHTKLSDLDIIINKKKQSRIIKTAKHFITNNRKYNKMYMRFDVIVVQSNPFLKGPLALLHLKDAFGDLYD